MTTTSQPRYLEIAESLDRRIRQGEWATGGFPTVRVLAAQNAVSIVTASRAMQALRDRGLIRIVERSGAFVAPAAQQVVGNWAVWARLTPSPMTRESFAMLRSEFESAAAAAKCQLTWDGLPELPPDGRPLGAEAMRRAAESLRAAGVTGVALLPSRSSEAAARDEEAFLDAARELEMPTVLLERNLRGADRPLPCDLVSADDFRGGSLATRHLLEQGCRRVGFVTGSPTSSHQMRLGGYLHALAQAKECGFPEPGQAGPVILWQDAELPPREAYRDLAARAKEAKLDGVVCYQDYTALGLVMELLRRGVRVPADVAVVGFDNLPVSDSFAIGLTTYAFPYAAITARALALLHQRTTDRQSPPAHVQVPGALVCRESSDRAGAGIPPEISTGAI